MKKLISILTVVLIFSFSNINAQKINKDKSKVTFEVINMKVNTVPGTFTGMEGEIVFNKRNLAAAKFNVNIDASSVNTDNEKRDNHLKNEDFFNVDKFPKIIFNSSKVYRYKDNYVTEGKLTMHGVTKKIMLPFTYDGKVFKGALKINRLDYGVGEGTSEYSVANEISLTIECVIE